MYLTFFYILSLIGTLLSAHTPSYAQIESQVSECVPVVKQRVLQKININTADVATLIKLPGIGLNKAKAIIDYRREHGAFQQVRELLAVKGISQKLFAKIVDSLTF